MKVDDLTQDVIGGAIEVHSALGPGLLESTYEACLKHELELRGLSIEQQKHLPITYKGMNLDCGYRIDMIVEGKLILELKSVSELKLVHQAQLLSYMRLTGCCTGLLINFNVGLLKHGIRRLKL